MNKKNVNKFLLARDKCVPEMHLRRPGFKSSACGPFTKTTKEIHNIKRKRDYRYIYPKKLG